MDGPQARNLQVLGADFDQHGGELGAKRVVYVKEYSRARTHTHTYTQARTHM